MDYLVPLVAGLLGGTGALVPWTLLSAVATLAMGPFTVQMVVSDEFARVTRSADIVVIFGTILMTMGGFFRTRRLAQAETVEALRDLATQVETRRQAEEAALNADRAKGAFLATMSHELRTPMNGVIGMADLLLEMPLGDQQRRCAEVIKNSGEALMSLLNDLLDYSKIEEATRRLRRKASRHISLPVIALTAHAMSGYREAVILAGMNDFLTKPLRRDQLALTLARIIGPPVAEE